MRTAVFFLVFFLISGCRQDVSPGKLDVFSGNNQFIRPMQMSRPLIVVVSSRKIPGLLGGAGESEPVGNVKVDFKIISNGESFFDASGIREKTVVSDEGGKASVTVTAGSFTGDILVRAACQVSENEILSKTFRITSGAVLTGDNQEGVCFNELENPVGIKLFHSDGSPASGIPVEFEFSENYSGRLSSKEAVTDAEGIAETSVMLGRETGIRNIIVSPRNDERNIRSGKIRFFSLNVSEMIWVLAGGLAIFIYGMKLMTEGLQRIAGNRMKKILGVLISNSFSGLLAGTAVTAVIQSSSACTVMVVGFVNAGLMNLKQAMSVILGANIGTTVTGQIIAFKVENLAYPAVICGLLMMLLYRGKKAGYWGEFIFGFGLLFMGMNMMKDALNPLKYSIVFREFFATFNCAPVNGFMPFTKVLGAVFIGTMMTAVIQSSSATIGLTMAMAGAGLLNFWTAFPLILGDNIGTTVTAVFAGIPANKNAKQAALFHTVFNVTGTVVMIALLYIFYRGKPVFIGFIDWITPGSVLNENAVNIERHIAVAHTMFNVTMSFCFLPFLVFFQKLIEKIMPAGREKIVLKYLEPYLLETPALAFLQVNRELAYMIRVAVKNVFRAFRDLLSGTPQKKEKITQREETVDRLQAEITAYLVSLSKHQLSDYEASAIPVLIHCVNDAERIGDHAENILQFLEEKKQNQIGFSAEADAELISVKEMIDHQYENVLRVLENGDRDFSRRVLKQEEEIRKYIRTATENHFRRFGDGVCPARNGILFVRILESFERIGNHLCNIAERICELSQMENS